MSENKFTIVNSSTSVRIVDLDKKIFFNIEGKEMLRIEKDGFYVKGKFVRKDEQVYYAFVKWLGVTIKD